MSKSERRKIYCSVLFHLLAIVCMLWSVYVLVKRTAEEIRLGKNGQSPPSPFVTADVHEHLWSEAPFVSPCLTLLTDKFAVLF